MKRAATTAAAVKSKIIQNKNVKTATGSTPNTEILVSPKTKQLTREFYSKPSVELSRSLLGKVLVRKLPSGEIIKGTIVETEAYPGTNVDEASASYNGKVTDKNRAMFMDPGTAYVYMTYGMYHCFNISSEGEGSACLLRAIEPFEYYETMQNYRQKSRKKSTSKSKVKELTKFKLHELTNGPGKLCMAFDIRRENCDKMDLATSNEMWLEEGDDCKENVEIVAAKRIGIDGAPVKARDKLWRFYFEKNMFVSTAKPSQFKKASETVNEDEKK